MTRTQRFRPVVKHIDNKEQLALRQVGQSQAMLEDETTKLARLQDYKLEYLQKKKYDIGVFTSIELQEFNRFMLQLDEAIVRQMEMVELRNRELAQKRRLWKVTRIDSKKMHKVVDRLQQQEFVEQERKEQKAMDEFVQRKNNRY